MIYTVTLNPAIDYVIKLKSLDTGEINRTIAEDIVFGGKGLNVSSVLTRLGIPNIALGFVSGVTGEIIEKGLRDDGVKTDLIKLKEGFSRINVKIAGGEETQINGYGPHISHEDLNKLYGKIRGLQTGDMLIMSGSVRFDLPDTVYEDMIAQLRGKDIKLVVDASKELLVNTLKHRPFLIKPNHTELCDLFGREVSTKEDCYKCAQALQQKGARNVIISLSGKGALLLDENGKKYEMDAASGKVISTVGSGDSMVAGFVAGWILSGDYEYALKLGIAAGGATAFSSKIAQDQEIWRVFDLMQKNTKK
ncbi:MAG: 1-phosphofructokinase [Oscillospiraceae bacterium]|jgi:1-phosphofructokinase|nr:1-phosphofructokinase [Oscillospiraceae bacterium]